MATIVLNESAPDDLIQVSLGNAELDSFPYETTDPDIVSNASVHPWLSVEYPAQEESPVNEAPVGVRPEDDPLSAQHANARLAFDLDAVQEVEDAKAADEVAEPYAYNKEQTD